MTILPLKNTPHTTTQMALPLFPKPDQPVGTSHHPPELQAREEFREVFWGGVGAPTHLEPHEPASPAESRHREIGMKRRTIQVHYLESWNGLGLKAP